MPDILAPHQKNNHLGDVGGVIADPFEMLRNEDQFDGTRD
jgi:hypothetical protein